MKKSVQKVGVTLAVFLMPAVAFAQSLQSTTNATSLFYNIKQILNGVIPIIIALAVVYILWGIVQSFIQGGEEERKAGHMKILYGIIALFIMVSIWGLVNILVNTAGLQGGTPIQGNQPGNIPNVANLGQ